MMMSVMQAHETGWLQVMSLWLLQPPSQSDELQTQRRGGLTICRAPCYHKLPIDRFIVIRTFI